MVRIYAARALAMGTAFLTSGQPERARWTRLSLAVDISDSATGITHLLRRDSSLRATVAMIALAATTAITASTHVVLSDDPGGQGCDANGNCGSGGQNAGPGGGPGGQGCDANGNCGSGGQNAGPGGVPGGQGCIPGVGCGSGHG
jgi:hypothetical protein